MSRGKLWEEWMYVQRVLESTEQSSQRDDVLQKPPSVRFYGGYISYSQSICLCPVTVFTLQGQHSREPPCIVCAVWDEGITQLWMEWGTPPDINTVNVSGGMRASFKIATAATLGEQQNEDYNMLWDKRWKGALSTLPFVTALFFLSAIFYGILHLTIKGMTREMSCTLLLHWKLVQETVLRWGIDMDLIQVVLGLKTSIHAVLGKSWRNLD